MSVEHRERKQSATLRTFSREGYIDQRLFVHFQHAPIRGASTSTLYRRMGYGGRKGRQAARRFWNLWKTSGRPMIHYYGAPTRFVVPIDKQP